LEVESDKYWVKNKSRCYEDCFHDWAISTLDQINHLEDEYSREFLPKTPAIQPSQIRQILIHLQDILGENPEYNEIDWKKKGSSIEFTWDEWNTGGLSTDYISFLGLKLPAKHQAEALCQKWLDGLNPMIDSNPEKVLGELNEIIKTLL
jgi:hypothetical protein